MANEVHAWLEPHTDIGKGGAYSKIVKAGTDCMANPHWGQPFETEVIVVLTEKAFDLLVLTDQGGTVGVGGWWLFSLTRLY